MANKQKHKTGLRISDFAKSFSKAAGELFSLEELVKDLGIDNPDDFPEEAMSLVCSLGNLFYDAKEQLLKEPESPVIDRKGVRKFIGRNELVIHDDLELYTDVIYKALLSKAYNKGRHISFIEGELGKKKARMLEDAGHRCLVPEEV